MAQREASRQTSDDPAQLVEMFRNPAWGASKLADIPLFERFTPDELVQLYGLGKLIQVKSKANIVIEGEPTRGLYMILHGTVSVYKTDPVSGAMARLALLEEGSNFGELSLFDASPRSATVVAETLTYVFHLDADAFNKALQTAGGDLQVRFYKTCAEDLAARFRRLNGDYIVSQQLLWKYALRKDQ